MLQNKLYKRNTANARRKLFDNQIKLKGEEVNTLVITSIPDPDFPDDEEMQVVDTKIISAVINFPDDEVTLTSNSNGKYTETLNPTQTNFHLYNILPIEAYFKFEDFIKEGDIIVYKYTDSNNISSPILFKVTRLNGGGLSRFLTWKQYILSMEHIDIGDEVRQLIDEYMTDDRF